MKRHLVQLVASLLFFTSYSEAALQYDDIGGNAPGTWHSVYNAIWKVDGGSWASIGLGGATAETNQTFWVSAFGDLNIDSGDTVTDVIIILEEMRPNETEWTGATSFFASLSFSETTNQTLTDGYQIKDSFSTSHVGDYKFRWKTKVYIDGEGWSDWSTYGSWTVEIIDGSG